MLERYRHTQVGYLTIVILALSCVLIVALMATADLHWITLAVLVIVGVALVLFSSLTVVIGDDVLEVWFGPGLIRKRLKLRDIESCQVVKNHWYYGWGIRLTPHGWLFNVSGFYAVEVKMKTGKKYRIGTDVPRELDEAIRQATRV